MRRWLQTGVVLGAALLSCQPADSPKPEVFSEMTCPDGQRWQGRPCDVGEPPVIEISPVASSVAPQEPEATEMPAFLDLAIDPRKRFPLRAKVRRNGALYERRDGGVLDPGDGRVVLWPELVLDPDRGGSPRRPRLLCDEANHRVAVHRDVTDLATVALAGALMVPSQKLPVVTASMPGVRLEAGVIVKPLTEPKQGIRRIAYKGLFLEATGWVDQAHVDVVFEPQPLTDDGMRDGELVQDVELKDAPAGRVVASVNRAPQIANKLYVRTMSAPRAGHTLIRYDDGHAQAVGWVPTAAIKAFAPKKLGIGGGGRGYGTGSGPRVSLVKGTLLRSDASGAILGIVTRDGDFRCEADCDTTAPKVLVGACAGQLRLRATRK